jgi:hypothetical protein
MNETQARTYFIHRPGTKTAGNALRVVTCSPPAKVSREDLKGPLASGQSMVLGGWHGKYGSDRIGWACCTNSIPWLGCLPGRLHGLLHGGNLKGASFDEALNENATGRKWHGEDGAFLLHLGYGVDEGVDKRMSP